MALLSPAVSETALPSPAVNDTGTLSATASSAATSTASPSTTQPICRGMINVRPLSGASGAAPARSAAADGTPAMYTSGTCASGFSSFFPGPRLVYFLSLGAATPLGGTLTITTCGHTANDTVLYVGTGCPSWDRPFACRRGNDNAEPACGSNAFASTLAITTSQSVYYIQFGGFDGPGIVSGLGWSYAPPAVTPSGSATRSRSGSATRSRSRSRSASRSRSRTASRTRSRKAK